MNRLAQAVLPLMIFAAVVQAEDGAGQGLTAMAARWQQASSKGFSSADEARLILGAYSADKAALEALKAKPGDLKAEVDGAAKAQTAFESYLQRTRGSLEKELTGWLRSATMMAKRWDMVSQQALASGTNVPQHMIMMYQKSTRLEELKKKVGIFTAIAGKEDGTAKSFNEQLAVVEKVGVKMGAVDSAVTPRDSYAGNDKGQLKAAIMKTWKGQYPKDAILGIRFIDEKWSRRTEKRYNNVTGWYPLDFSSLEVRVVVKEDDQIAGIYPVYVTKDHLKGDALELDVETARSAPAFRSQMLLKNYKP